MCDRHAGVDELVLSDSDGGAFDITEISGVETIHAQVDDVLTITTNDTDGGDGALTV